LSVFGQTLKGRFAVLGIIILLVFGALLVQLWSMQIIWGQSFADAAYNNRIRPLTIAAPRGRIFDRNGKPLVINRPALAVTAAPSVLSSQTLLAKLSAVTKVPVAEIKRRIVSTKMEALQPRILMMDAPQADVSYLSEHSGDFPGVEVKTVPVREYPYGALASHVLGYVGDISEEQRKEPDLKNYSLSDVVGKAGVEREFETVLQGDKGYQRLEVDAKGRVRAVLDRQEPIPGHDVKLTIDIDVQKVAEQALANALVEAHKQKFPKARAGAAVVLDVRTGEIVAMASAPAYDPRQFLNGISPQAWRSLNATASEWPLNNRAVSAAYPPASTFKVVTGLAGLQQGFVTASTAYDCPYTWYFPGHENSKTTWWMKHDWNPAGHGVIDFLQAVAQSADTYFYPLGYKFYQQGKERDRKSVV
jgi:penicillin-binding protein 2